MFRLVFFSCYANFKTWKEMVDERTQKSTKDVWCFLKTHKGWPDRDKIALKGELALDPSSNPSFVLEWFKTFPPQTGQGAMLYIDALHAKGMHQEAQKITIDTWVEKDFPLPQEQAFLQKYKLPPSAHEKRAQRLLYEEKCIPAKRLLSYVSKQAQQEILQRVCMIERKAAALSIDSAHSEGLLYEHARYCVSLKRNDDALRILLHYRNESAPYPSYWWKVQNLLARRFLESNQYEKAFSSLNKPCLELSGEDRADKLWLQGFCAFLNKRREAQGFFKDIFETTRMPISRARGAYWAGLASHDECEKKQWLEKAGQFYYTYYGILAREQLGETNFFRFKSCCPSQCCTDTELLKATLSINPMKEGAETFKKFIKASCDQLCSLEEGLSFLEKGSQRVHSQFRSFFKIVCAKGIVSHFKKHPCHYACFPDLPVENHPPLHKALIMAVARQESEFNPYARSYANALGYMQLLLSTARIEAKKMGLKVTSERDLFDARKNIIIGGSHILRLVEKYDGCLVLALCAYNAGPHRAQEWIETFGDPRKPGTNMILWVETIPFKQTRDYVMRVLENTYIYLHKMGKPACLSNLLSK